MRIIITENQMKTIVEEFGFNREKNSKPANVFDELYDTDLSGHYDFSPYTEEELWNYWLDCRDDDNCENFKKALKILPKIYPYYDINKLNHEQRAHVLLGAISGYNPEDIYYFSILGVTYMNNVEQKELEKQLPYDISRKLQWVLSPGTIEKIKSKFSLL